jgi:hypothetical protein
MCAWELKAYETTIDLGKDESKSSKQIREFIKAEFNIDDFVEWIVVHLFTNEGKNYESVVYDNKREVFLNCLETQMIR